MARLHEVIACLHEFNPMMGHRGCRLAVSYPEIAEMQTTAVINAAINVTKKGPVLDHGPQIMIPLVGEVKELKFVKDVVVATADKIIKESGIDMKYEVGTMIEIPRAALTADEIATEAEFFCFGTNDLTQMTFGFCRDDAGKFLELLLREEDLRVRSVCPPGPEGRGQAGEDGCRAGPQDPSRTSTWASAASMAATRPPSSSAITWA